MDIIDIQTNEDFNSKIIIKEGLKSNLADFLEDKKYFLITNTTLKRLYPDVIKQFDKDKVIVIKDGEKYKNLKTFEYVLNELIKRRIERKDCVVALGGGVVGDIAGFCASSVLRGVELIQIPTTLLAMCDSSIGGKTGVNSRFGKNLIGSFYLAKKVLIDPEFTKTLNSYEYKCGMGEILKYAFIEKSCRCDTGYNLIKYLDSNEPVIIKNNIKDVIKVCAYMKANVVEKDNFEAGLRKILNFGHTFAHPVETLSNYKKISHGEAVAWGMKCAAKLGLKLKKIDEGYCNKINSLIDKFNLVEHKINFPKSKIINLMMQDKKVNNGKINLLVPTAVSEVELFDNIDLPLLEASLP